MYSEKTTEQKIAALFFRALQPADRNLKPSQIVVTIETSFSADATPAERKVMIDLSRTSFVKKIPGMCSGLNPSMWRVDSADGTLQYSGAGNLERVGAETLQKIFAASTHDPVLKDRFQAALKGTAMECA